MKSSAGCVNTPLDGNGKTLYQTTEVRDDGGAYTAFSGYEGESVPYQTARFIRVSAVSSGLVLSEVAFQDENGDPYPIQNVISDHDGELVDEQDAVPAYPTYLNSTYFDEIYHARTAYEQLHCDDVRQRLRVDASAARQGADDGRHSSSSA